MHLTGQNQYGLMVDHLTRSQIEQFQAKALAAEVIIEIAEHLEECRQCHSIFLEEAQKRRRYEPFSFSLSEEDWFKDDHLEFDDIVGLTEDRLDAEYAEILNIHLRVCKRCRAAVEDLKEFKRELEPELSVRYLPESEAAPLENGMGAWKWPASNWNLRFATSVLIIITFLVLGIIIIDKYRVNRQSNGELVDGRPDTIPPTPQISVSVSPTPSPSIVPADELIALNDNGNRVILDKSGDISGLENLPMSAQRVVREVLAMGDIKKPRTLSDISGVSGTLRGPNDRKLQFKIISPSGVVTATDRPTFQWEHLKGVTSYQVQVGDINGREAASSNNLPPGTTRWTPKLPLKRGEIYAWTVIAFLNGERVITPRPQDPEAKFKVLDNNKLNELRQIKRNTGSHLSLGLFYANAGMVTDAEREFQQLLNENPHSTIVAKLLKRVQSWRQ